MVEVHFGVDDLTKDWLTLVGNHCDEVASLGGIVVAFEADGAAVVRNGIIGHVVIMKKCGENGNRLGRIAIRPYGLE